MRPEDEPTGRTPIDTLPPPGPSSREPVPSTPPEPPPKGEEPTPPPAHSYEDRVAFSQAFADVRPLARRQRGGGGDYVTEPYLRRPADAPSCPSAPVDSGAEARARARLDALVAGGVQFHVDRDEGWVEGERKGAPREALRGLRRRGVVPEAQLDLHGLVAEEAERKLARFIRERHRRGVRRLLVVHGKGHHSEGGAGVLGDRVVRVLTEGRAAPLVDAFITAPARLGGGGALLVQLGAK